MSQSIPYDDSQFQLVTDYQQGAVIKVLGIGGGGCNTLASLQANRNNLPSLEGVELIYINTDAQALKCKEGTILQIGNDLTKGLGAGANPQIGQQAAEEDRDRIREILEGADMIFITAGMGGGTGTGAAPVIAAIAKELNILTVAVVTRPFAFEGKMRAQIAAQGIYHTAKHVDSLIIIPNDRLLSVFDKKLPLLAVFQEADKICTEAVTGISELITSPGLINLDFADLRAVMSIHGIAMMGIGIAEGEGRAKNAAETAISSPLLEDIDLSGAQGVLVNITAGMNMTIGEFEEVGEVVKRFTSDEAIVVIGTVINQEMKDGMKVTIVVTGLSRLGEKEIKINSNLSSNKNINNVNYTELEKPTVITKKYQLNNNTGNRNNPLQNYINNKEENEESNNKINTDKINDNQNEKNNNYFDIPAFLRKKEKDKK